MTMQFPDTVIYKEEKYANEWSKTGCLFEPYLKKHNIVLIASDQMYHSYHFEMYRL